MFNLNEEYYDGEVINLTPHTITVIHDDGDVWHIEPSGTVARMLPAEPTPDDVGTLNGFPLARAPKYVGVVGLPSEPDGNLYIVSAIVGTNVGDHPLRQFLVGPDTNQAVRENGQIVGVRGFISYAP